MNGMNRPVSSIRNIGPAMQSAFARADIHTAEALHDIGPDAAYAKLLAVGERPHFIAYYAMVMGLQGRPWNDCRGAEKDALRARQGNGPHRADELARTPIFVSPSKSVIEMLAEMRSSREHMAFVVDEFGGIDGLITMEDLIEQIVGKIEDEHDAQAPSMDQVSPEEMTADAGLPLDEAEERLGPFLTDEEREEEVDTIGGLLFTMSGRIPVRGEQLTHSSGIKFLILDATPRRIRKVRISGVAERLAKSNGSENANAPALAQTQEPEGTVQNDPKDDASGANA